MKRSDGAKAWSTVLSELAQVRVSVAWERPTWRVSYSEKEGDQGALDRRPSCGLGRSRRASLAQAAGSRVTLYPRACNSRTWLRVLRLRLTRES